MKTTVTITGQIGSVSTLAGAIEGNESKRKNLHCGGYIFEFTTKYEAIKALSNGYRLLVSDREDWKNSMGLYTRGSYLSYDAGSATINNE